MQAITRRTFVAAGAAGVALPTLAAERGADSQEIVLGQIVAVSGPLAAVTTDIVKVAGAWFDGVNERGGIHGRRVKLVTLDDGYVPANSVKAARTLIEEQPAFALMNMTGTGNVAAILPMLDESGVPLFGPITGADSLRGASSNVFHLRASYADETEKIVQHCTTLGLQRLGVVALDNGFGKDGLAGLQKALGKRSMTLAASATLQPDGSDADKAVAALFEARPQAVVLITTGKATVDFIKRCNAVRKGMRFYALSVMGTQSTLKALGPDGVGTVVTSVVPFPWSAAPVAREYRAAMQKIGHDSISFIGMESWLNARVVTEALRRAGPQLTRAKFVAALEGLRKLDLGGFEVGYSKENHQGSRFVELTIVGPGEKFTR